jgi:hypothetical protein
LATAFHLETVSTRCRLSAQMNASSASTMRTAYSPDQEV